MRIIGNDPSTPRQAQIVASGTLSTGDTVVVNSDGTVSVVSGASAGAGTPVTYNGTDATIDIGAAFDSNSNKVVIAYRDAASRGSAIVGTVSGSSISFGTEVTFESGGSVEYTQCVFDSTNNKVVICYKDVTNSNRGTAIVGTVSGTSISFGSASVFETGNTFYIAPSYDTNSQKVVIGYSDGSNGFYGTAVVGTVSGTSISFGTPVVYSSASSEYIDTSYDANAQKVAIFYRASGVGKGSVGTVSGTSISFGSASTFSSNDPDEMGSVYDPSSQKVVVAYKDSALSKGMAQVATISGTSMTYGAAVEFNDDRLQFTSMAYDSDLEKIVISYSDIGNSRYGTFIGGKVSGTSISFDAKVVFSESRSEYEAAVYDSNAQKVVIAYRDNDDSNYGKAVVGNVLSTNLTTENYIGTAASGAADTQRAKINLKGAVDENQSGLTSGQSYYVQTDGTLGTTPADPSVFAGTAVAANKLIVKG